MPTVVYRRFTAALGPAAAEHAGAGNQNLIPGPLLRARVGDRIVVHFKNLDFARRAPHSMHFHGVRYKPSSDGAYVPGVSGRDGDVMPGRSWTYRLTALPTSVGVWPYHDHSPSMDDSIAGGMYGMLSIIGRHEAARTASSSSSSRRWATSRRSTAARSSATRRSSARTSASLVQWDVMAMGSEHHSFHVHGHRWLTPGGIPRDTQTVGPAESFRVRWRERDPGTWLYHCHVEEHMAAGMIGTYRVTRR